MRYRRENEQLPRDNLGRAVQLEGQEVQKALWLLCAFVL